MNLLLTNGTDIFAGGEDYVLILARYLTRRGHRVYVAANPGHLLLQKSEEAGLPILPVSFTGMNRVFAVGRELRRHLAALEIDIVHSNANYDRTAAAIAAAFSRVHHVAGVHSSHSIQHNVTHWVRNRYGIDHFVADARSITKVLMEEDGISEDRITEVPIGVEASASKGNRELRSKARQAFGIADDTVVVGNVARLVPFKGQSVLIDAAARVTALHSNVVFVIVGDGELLDTLRDQAATLGITQNVKFLGFRDDLDLLYAGFDVYCHSSLELAAEAFPLAILRALAAGLPVVCTNVGGIGMMVHDGVSGYLLPPNDPSALGDALKKTVGDRALRDSMGQESFDLFERNYHAAAMAEKMEKLYEQVIAKP